MHTHAVHMTTHQTHNDCWVHKTQALSIKHLVLGCDALKLRRRTSCALHVEEGGERETERGQSGIGHVRAYACVLVFCQL